MSLPIPIVGITALTAPAARLTKLMKIVNTLLTTVLEATTIEEVDQPDNTTKKIPVFHPQLEYLLTESRRLTVEYSRLTHDVQSQDFRDKIAAFEAIQKSNMVSDELKESLTLAYFKKDLEQ